MLLRFLRARDFNVEKARAMLSESLTWRKKHAVDRIIAEYQVPQVVTDYFPGGWHHYDKGKIVQPAVAYLKISFWAYCNRKLRNYTI